MFAKLLKNIDKLDTNLCSDRTIYYTSPILHNIHVFIRQHSQLTFFCANFLLNVANSCEVNAMSRLRATTCYVCRKTSIIIYTQNIYLQFCILAHLLKKLVLCLLVSIIIETVGTLTNTHFKFNQINEDAKQVASKQIINLNTPKNYLNKLLTGKTKIKVKRIKRNTKEKTDLQKTQVKDHITGVRTAAKNNAQVAKMLQAKSS